MGLQHWKCSLDFQVTRRRLCQYFFFVLFHIRSIHTHPPPHTQVRVAAFISHNDQGTPLFKYSWDSDVVGTWGGGGGGRKKKTGHTLANKALAPRFFLKKDFLPPFPPSPPYIHDNTTSSSLSLRSKCLWRRQTQLALLNRETTAFNIPLLQVSVSLHREKGRKDVWRNA